MATKLVFEGDLGDGLKIDEVTNKVEVKVDGTTIGLNASGQLESLGGGDETFVASGALPSGAVVALRSDGKVELVVATPGQQLGNEVVFHNAYADYTSATFDSANGKVVIAYRDEEGFTDGFAIVGTVSGNSISFGSAVDLSVPADPYVGITFDSTNGKVVVTYPIYAIVGTVSGNSISFGSQIALNGGYSTNTNFATFDSTNGRTVVVYNDNNNSYKCTANVFNTTPAVATNADKWVGIAKSTAADTAPVSLFLDGQTATTLVGLTPGAQYYLSDAGVLTTTANSRYVGRALSSTKLRIVGCGKL